MLQNNEGIVQMTLKQGELVTVDLGERSTSSNTYQIARKLEGESLLAHPLFPECFILKRDDELNHVLAQLKSPTERCLDYVKKYRKYLNHNDCSEVDSLCLYFVVRRSLSDGQKKQLANLCGKISAIYCDNDLLIAVRTVNDNVALLDHFNLTWYRNFQNCYKRPELVLTQARRAAIFNQAGFVLAQLEGGN